MPCMYFSVIDGDAINDPRNRCITINPDYLLEFLITGNKIQESFWIPTY
ncbi:unnamed protein product [Debaryomyces fabryi]|nr:unnamed protein product [Debaryomyces fabryi]